MRALVLTVPRYNRTEFIGALRGLLNAGIERYVISREPIIGDERGTERLKANETIATFDIRRVAEFDAVIAISGNNKDVEWTWYNAKVKSIIEAFARANKVCAGICLCAPTVRYALNGKRATCFPLDKALALMRAFGAVITGRSLEVDGNCVTAENEAAVDIWMDAVVARMRGEPVNNDLAGGVAEQYFRYWRGRVTDEAG